MKGDSQQKKKVQRPRRMLRVPVPADRKGGDRVTCIIEGRACSVQIPASAMPGDVFKILVPEFPTADTDVNKRSIELVVPDGKVPGDKLSFSVENKVCTVIIPKSAMKEGKFSVVLPNKLEVSKNIDQVKATAPKTRERKHHYSAQTVKSIAEVIMHEADSINTNNRLSTAELASGLTDTPFEPFLKWLCGHHHKRLKRFDKDDSGSLDLEELIQSMDEYLVDNEAPMEGKELEQALKVAKTEKVHHVPSPRHKMDLGSRFAKAQSRIASTNSPRSSRTPRHHGSQGEKA